jgi:hypothetical protein
MPQRNNLSQPPRVGSGTLARRLRVTCCHALAHSAIEATINDCTIPLATSPGLLRRPVGYRAAAAELSSDAGVLPLRQFDQRVGLIRAFTNAIDDPRDADLACLRH